MDKDNRKDWKSAILEEREGISNAEQGMSNVEVFGFTSTFDIPCSIFDILFC